MIWVNPAEKEWSDEINATMLLAYVYIEIVSVGSVL